MSRPLSYSLSDIERRFGVGTMTRAKACVERVKLVEKHPARISAQVQGSSKQPYRVQVLIMQEKDGKPGFQSHCTCPVGAQCKHGAAALIAALLGDGAAAPSPALLDWLESFRRVSLGQDEEDEPRAGADEALLYVLAGGSRADPRWRIDLYKGRLSESGQIVAAQLWSHVERALLQPPRFVDPEDMPLLRLMWALRQGFGPGFPLGPHHGLDFVERLVDSGRFYFAGDSGGPMGKPLVLGESRPGQLEWRLDQAGHLRPHIATMPPASHVLPLEDFCFIDVSRGQAGRVRVAGHVEQLRVILTVPPLKVTESGVVASAIRDMAPGVAAPDAAWLDKLEHIEDAPKPVLKLGTLDGAPLGGFRDYPWITTSFDYAQPWFAYGPVRFCVGDEREFMEDAAGRMLRVSRDPVTEQGFLRTLLEVGFTRVPQASITASNMPAGPIFGLASKDRWPDFMHDTVPRLQAAGWHIEMPSDFRHHVMAVEDWHLDVEEAGGGWFDIHMDIEVDGQPLPLAPMLADLFQHESRWLDPIRIHQIAPDEQVVLTTPEGVRLGVKAERIKPLALTLIDLFDAPPGVSLEDGPLKLSQFDALRLLELEGRCQFGGLDTVRRLAERLRALGAPQPQAAPAGFQLELRHYQESGLGWLQYLRSNDLSGILADDMGLGKTAQALAHILTEKCQGRLTCPALVVVPTSLIHNWKNEAARFAPDLRVLILHGNDRKDKFDLIRDHDLVLTTYPLLWRDEDLLTARAYHLLILDEAQTVKNAGSRGAAVVRRLDARHRLCLTGTPLENHLGELWSQFDFLLPGFLGDAKSFVRQWRTPIEKGGDILRRDLLSRRVRPFILRRRKEDVATELPPKTQIISTVVLEGRQRDLYETVRAAVDEEVRSALAARGFARSQIVILDALLKLRQVCCDPRLLRSQAGKPIRESAKLALLKEMLPDLVGEGRRILLFSQFTTMLDLIELELKKLDIRFVRLDGNTQDRETPVKAFQHGDVPLFLISLKAGGVGLNLTAADTVIHYDPWWNPAAENQATDRAHRIGQDKPVFVYKLIAAGGIEEKILALQEKKADLAAGILSGDGAALSKFNESDIEALLAPLP